MTGRDTVTGMSTDIAYPVFRTPDPALALSTARRLMEFGRREHSEVSVYAALPSPRCDE